MNKTVKGETKIIIKIYEYRNVICPTCEAILVMTRALLVIIKTTELGVTQSSFIITTYSNPKTV